MSITKRSFGNVEGKEAQLISLTNKNGMTVNITNYGATVVGIIVPDKHGKFDDVVIGYNSAKQYAEGPSYFGATVGRYANRIAGGKFTLNGIDYSLALNDNGVNCLHGGNRGYNKRFWEIIETEDGNEPSVSLLYSDPDGEENFPGTVDVRITFTVTDNNGFKIEYFAKSDKDTIMCLTNHSYFNLSGYNSGSILNHLLKINAEYYTPIDKYLIPTGEIASVYGTPFDFTDFRRLGDGLEKNCKELECYNGYDHNFVLNNTFKMQEIAVAKDTASGRIMTVYSDMPAVQLYTGNFLNSSETGKDGKPIKKHTGFCLETQFTPNTPNLGDKFPTCVLKANDEYKHITIYKFDAE